MIRGPLSLAAVVIDPRFLDDGCSTEQDVIDGACSCGFAIPGVKGVAVFMGSVEGEKRIGEAGSGEGFEGRVGFGGIEVSHDDDLTEVWFF